MGKIKEHSKVKNFVAITVSDVKRLPQLLSDLDPIFGKVDLKSDWFSVDFFTHYYANEMGRDLQKIFISFTALTLIENLPQFKISTNELENKYRQGKNRTVNLDPGYLTEAKVVLATTKDFSHRLYLGQGIYGDLHLVYKDGAFHPQSWTYPDYKQELAISYFSQLRTIYKQQIRKS